MMNEDLLVNDFAKVTKANSVNNIEILTIQHHHCQAKISLYGGQVLSYQPYYLLNDITNDIANNVPSDSKVGKQYDVFWLSHSAIFAQGKAIRGGIPLCWPWFGANDKATKKCPSTNHGFAREVVWQIASIEANKAEVTVELVFQGENQHPLWPSTFSLRQTLVFGKTFKQVLSMTNLSKEDAQYSGALHSYFRVSDPKEISIEALTNAHFDDKLTAKHDYQKESVSCVGPIDRVYHVQESKGQSNTMTLVDQGWHRKIEVTSVDCAQWVLWNPGVELASNMADIHVGGEQEFVCLEAANSQWQVLPPNKTITMSQEIKVSII